VTIITSRVNEEVKILGILKDRKKETVKYFLKSIPKHLKETVVSVSSDMYDGFINASKEVFGQRVRVVIDRFHVAKLYRKVVDNIRKQEMRKLKELLSEEEYKKFKGVMWILRKNKLSEDEKSILKKLFEHSTKLKKVYELSNDLTSIFNTKTSKNGGIRRLKNWIAKVKNSKITSYDSFILTLSKRLDEIANYFVSRENSGFVEGLNNRLKVLKRRCYGIINKTHLFQRISLDMGTNYSLPIIINF